MPVILAGRYVCEAPISKGGMATVWRARDDVLARPVAVKILHAHLAEDEGFLERFRREALAAARLTHPNIVSIFDTGSEPDENGSDQHFIVMEYCGNGTLASVLKERGVLPAERVASIGATICDALGYAHRMGIVHRDVKPANVLIASDGTLKVADFGIAKAAFVARDVTTTGSILGTVAYLSPEQGRGTEPDARSDLYALGVVLYELLVGRPPFEGETQIATAMMHVREAPPPPRSLRAGVPKQLEATILRALAKDPEGRFTTAEEMRASLLSTTPGGEHTTRFAPPEARPEPEATGPSGDWRWVVAVLALIAVAVAATLVFSSTDDGAPNPNGDGTTEGGGDAAPIRVASVSDFDPHGGDGEHPEDAGLAVDGNESTAWTTSDYNDPFSLIGKPGVGLLFDLGSSREVDSVTVVGADGAEIELRAGEELGSDESSFDVVGSETAAATTELEAGRAARYWLVWITALPGGGGGRASIAEVEFIGP